MTSHDEQQLQRMTDDILGAQARYRHRSRWAVLAGVAVALAVAVPVALVVSHPVTAGHPVAVDRRTPTVPTTSPRTPGQQGADISDEAQIYAAVIGGPPAPGEKARPIYVMDEFCTGLMDLQSGRRGECEPGPIPLELQRQIRRISGPTVHFTNTAPQPALDRPVVTIGTASIDGDQARVIVDTECGPLCGEGQTTVLTRRNGTWRVTGSIGPAWIS